MLNEERESVVSRAFAVLPQGEARIVRELGIDPCSLLRALLDHMVANGKEGQPASPEVKSDMDRLLNDENISWALTARFIDALVKSITEHVDDGKLTEAADNLYAELIQAQSNLFTTFAESEMERKRKLLRYQHEIDTFPDTIAATLDPPTLAKVGLGRLKDLIGMEEATLFNVESPRSLISVAGDLAQNHNARVILELEGNGAQALLEKGEPYWEVPGGEPSCIGGLRKIRDISSALLLPMLVRGRVTGIVLLTDGSERLSFSRDEMELATSFANRLAVAMENAFLHSREQRKIKETVALLEITRAINSTLDLREILDKVVQMTVDLCGVVLCVVYLLEEETNRFVPAAHFGFIEEGLWEDERLYGFAVSELGPEMEESLYAGREISLPSREAGCLLPSDLTYEHGVDTVFLFPLSSKDNLTGVFSLFYTEQETSGLEREEIEVVSAIAAQASMAIENAALYEDIERSYFSTVKALAKAIEVKDPYTHGHSERVTEYALMIAEAMRLDERDKQKLKYAATLHDIGKIGIAGKVLNKPGALTDEEYMHVKTHPILGDSIIEPVEFLQGPRPIILHHHERYDGLGYPEGLKGRGIPLCARILSVADAFEAMRSDRPYRRALPLDTAKKELRRNSGTQFDPYVVEVFIEILETCGNDPVNR